MRLGGKNNQRRVEELKDAWLNAITLTENPGDLSAKAIQFGRQLLREVGGQFPPELKAAWQQLVAAVKSGNTSEAQQAMAAIRKILAPSDPVKVPLDEDKPQDAPPVVE